MNLGVAISLLMQKIEEDWMTDNERIAVWTGAKEADNDLCNLDVGDVVLRPDGGQLFSVGYITEQAGGKMVSYRPWSPDTDITLWHGADGLLAEIEKQGLRLQFIASLTEQMPRKIIRFEDGMWFGSTATPAQLTPALVAVLKETDGA